MTSHQLKLVHLIVEEYFGPVVGSICRELSFGPKPLKLLSTNVKLPMAVVKQALSVLINFYHVTFKISENGSMSEYSLLPENILLILHYTKFLLMIREKYGKEAEYIVQELLYSGRITLYHLIIKVAYNLSQANTEVPYSLSAIKNTVCDLIENDFIIPVGRVTDDIVPVSIKLTDEEKIPKIDMQKLSNLYHGTDISFPKNQMYWKTNFDRFLLEFRNQILIESTIRKNDDAQTGIIMHHLLKLSSVKLDIWRPKSNSLPLMMIRDSIGYDTDGTEALKYAEQYIRVMEEDSSGFVSRCVDKNGVIICFRDAIEALTYSCISQLIEQKFGCKAARIFRAVKCFKCMTVEMIQKEAMLADKEAKQITYKLLEENFLQILELRKPTSGISASGPTKSFFLFYVDLKIVVKMATGMCYQSIHNLYLRQKEEERKQSHLIEKEKQAEVLMKDLKEQQATEEQITEMISVILTPPEKLLLESLHKVTKKLFYGCMQIDETIMLLELYLLYNKTDAQPLKQKKKK